jgi:hypothetical protein
MTDVMAAEILNAITAAASATPAAEPSAFRHGPMSSLPANRLPVIPFAHVGD